MPARPPVRWYHAPWFMLTLSGAALVGVVGVLWHGYKLVSAKMAP